MEAILQQSTTRLQAAQDRLKSNTDLTPQQFEGEMKAFQDSLLSMARQCLGELTSCNNRFQDMSLSVKEAESFVRVLKDAKGVELRKSGNPCKQGAIILTANVESYEFKPLQIPAPGTFEISSKVLDQVGRQVGELGSGTGPALIKKIKAEDRRLWTWSRQADFFALKGSSEKTTFSELYR
jgi:antitoxin component HigA of HigAB toxin-antitoxin module